MVNYSVHLPLPCGWVKYWSFTFLLLPKLISWKTYIQLSLLGLETGCWNDFFGGNFLLFCKNYFGKRISFRKFLVLLKTSCQIWQYSEFSQIEEKYTALMAVTFFSTFWCCVIDWDPKQCFFGAKISQRGDL